MDEYREDTRTLDVPPNTGIDGFMRTLRTILKRPRVQRVVINANGKVEYTRYAIEGEEDAVGVDFADLQPYHIIRNSQVMEILPPPELPASTVLALMLDRVGQDRLHSVAFATGADTRVWAWFQYTTGYTPTVRTQLMGLPLLFDRQLPDTAILLCAGFGRDAALVDTQISYKVEMPTYATKAGAT